MVQADLESVPAATAVRSLVEAGVAVSSVAPRNRLEDVFLALVDDTGTPPHPGSTPTRRRSDEQSGRWRRSDEHTSPVVAPRPTGSGTPGTQASRTLGVRTELRRQLTRRRTQLSLGFLALLPFLLAIAFAFGGDDSELERQRGRLGRLRRAARVAWSTWPPAAG